MNDQRLGQLVGEWLQESCMPASDPREGVRRVVAQTAGMGQVGAGWLSRHLDEEVVPVRVPTTNGRRPARGFTMFSAVKFVAAGVVVALFGGFLLAGILTAPQDGEVAPAAVTESPSPMTTEELLSGMVTEEVEPGVYRVVNDGTRDLTPYLTSMMQTAESPGILAGDDGSVWVGTTPLGGEDVEFPPGWGSIIEFPPGWGPIDFVTADGTVWAARWSHDGERWTEHPHPPAEHAEWQSRDGTVLVAWPDVPDQSERDERRWTVARLDGDEWRLLGEPLAVPGDGWPEFYVTEDGDLWAYVWTNMNGITMYRWDGGEWIKDESRLRNWEGGAIPRWRDHVTPDGARWEAYDPDWDWDMEAEPCPSVVRIDGLREDTFLANACADSIDVGPDGSVWALARTGPDDEPAWELYVIAPEATTTERPATSARTDILPGVTLTVEEVEPGIFRVLHDGVRDLSSRGSDPVAGDDGSIWRMGDEGFQRLGYPTVPWPLELKIRDVGAFDVARDGTVWIQEGPGGSEPDDKRARDERGRLVSYEDGSWTVHLEEIDWSGPWTIAPDGTVWAVYPSKDGGEGLVAARLGTEGWEPLDGSLPAEPQDVHVTTDGEVWLVAEGRPWRYHEDDGEWETIAVDTDDLDIDRLKVAVMADGMVWVAGEEVRTADGEGDPFLMRFDGTGWQRWGPDDGVPSASSPEERFRWRDLEQAPDGALWVNYDIRKPEGHSIYMGRVERFDVDGSTWHRFLPGIDGLDGVVTPEGSVWLRPQWLSGYWGRGRYVITPEAVAATES